MSTLGTRKTILPRADGRREIVETLVCAVPECRRCPRGSYCRAFNQLRTAELKSMQRRESQAAWNEAFQPEVRDVFSFAWTVVVFLVALGLALWALSMFR